MEDTPGGVPKVRTRFAPSPTGSLHVGGARTALYNYLFAKKNQGTFVLRIEDTDVARSTEVSETVIIDDLRWLGLHWDEGPDNDGEVGPYRQSERLGRYENAGNVLKKSASLLYPCYCTEEELSQKRKAHLAAGRTPIYDGACRNLTREEIAKRAGPDRKFAWRFNVQASLQGKEKTVTVPDLIHGDVHFDASLIGDFVVIKSNGTPSYNFACVVDDFEMKITHVIRGDEHLTNTPRQILLYRALGWAPPQFAHLSMILAPDRTKLSKRHGTTAVGEFRQKGYLPHALLNYVALLGWSPKDEREIFSLEELARFFSLEGVSKNSAIFDTPKLNWMNAQYIRLLQIENLLQLTLPLFEANKVPPPPNDKLLAILSTQRNNFETLLDPVRFVEEFVTRKELNLEEPAKEVLTWPWTADVLASFEKELRALDEIAPEAVSSLMKRVQAETGKKGKDLFWPIRAAVSGKTHGPELVHLLPLLGKKDILEGIDRARAYAIQLNKKG